MDIKGFFRKALAKTQAVIREAFGETIPEAVLTELEDRLILSDAGPRTASRIIQEIRARKPQSPEDVRAHLKTSLLELLPKDGSPRFCPAPPTVWFLLGTNGSGKTTTAAKLAAHYRRENLRTALVAADTFRAAAIDQLRLWSERAGAELFAMQEGSHPSAVIFDAMSDKKIKSCDLILVDTAGRLHTKTSLLEELAKMAKSCEKSAPGTLVERLLVLDGTAGQNTLAQARIFHEALSLTGLIVTKLDASSKAGFLLSIGSDLKDVPVKWVAMGESLDDIAPFDPAAFVEGLVGETPA
ncbi:signal recognition particle-docking protein FtsY [bacterium]|nr:signal recognition particle-docking protein FtsY [bacterium]